MALLDSAGLRLLALSVDAEGGFELDLHAPGTYRVVASALGYSAATTPILSVAAGEIRELRIALPPLPFAVDSLRLVIPSPTRAQAAPARVGRLDASELAELLPQTSLLTLLRHLNMPSITVTEMYEPGSSFYMPCIQFVRSISPSNRGCRMVKIVLNGQGVPDAASFLQSFDPSLLIKVEFIPPALAGARWGVGSQNGVLLLEER